MSEIIDISLPITAAMPVYPGTAETKISTVKSASGTSTLSEITMTTHAGTHIDAPNHVQGGGSVGIDEMPLSAFYGACRVLDMTACSSSISIDDLQAHDIQGGERILLKTNNSVRGFNVFYDDYVYLESNAAQHLGSIGVALVGIDALSIKQRGAKDNTAHTALLSRGIPIIEGVNLANVEQGDYTLVAFPLAFQGIDGSPTRAVLVQDQ
jgi:arylformamidase